MDIPRVLVAGLRGGDGKTLVTVGLEAGWCRQGWSVAPFKKGPDYIDAAWSAAATGRPCRNLDLFLMADDVILRSFATGARTADFAVIEGNRGLFDGADARGSYSTAELAKRLGAPVILVLDCTKATRTVAALLLGCLEMDPDVPIAGVVLNRTGGARHRSVIRDAIAETTGLPVLGALPRLDHDLFPERHLGLLPPAERPGHVDVVREAAEAAHRYLDLESIAAVARSAPPLATPPPVPEPRAKPEGWSEPADRPRIGVFRDAAFQFYYPDNLEALESAGAELMTISPMLDRFLPDVDALYIGGGFPETMAPTLAENASFRHAVREAAEAGLPIYAECGGAVFLGERLDYQGRRYEMAGVLPAHFDFRERPQGHGYTVLEAVADTPFYGRGATVRGHEFHHTYLRSAGDDVRFAFRVRRGFGFDGEHDGLFRYQVLACYTHVHALSTREWAPALVRAAERFRTARAVY